MVVLPNILWLDRYSDGDEITEYVSQLKSLGYSNIKCSKTINDSINYLKGIKFVDTIIIVSGSLYFPFIKEFKNHMNDIYIIPKIIIFTSNIDGLKKSIEKDIIKDPFYNNGGIHNQFEDIKTFILNQSKGKKISLLEREDEGDLVFEYVDCQEKLALPTLYKLLIQVTPKDNIDDFTKKLYNQYSECEEIKELLKPIVSMSHIPNELLSKYYARTYSIESKFYSDLNRELRKKNNKDNKYLPFIKVLYEGFKFETLTLKPNKYLYRGSRVADYEINRIYNFFKNKKKDLPPCYVFSRSFLSFSKEQRIAEDFLEKQTPKGDEKVKTSKVLFILGNENNIDSSLSAHADIERLSYYEGSNNEREVLFFPFSSFGIQDIGWKDDQKRYEIKLTYLGKNIDLEKWKERKIFLPTNSTMKSSLSSDNILNSPRISCYSNSSGLSRNPQKINYNPTLPTEINQPIQNRSTFINISNLPDSDFKNLLFESGLVEPKEIESNNNTAKLMKTYEVYKKEQIQLIKNKNNSKNLNNIYIPPSRKNYIIKRFEIPQNEDYKLIPLKENKILSLNENTITLQDNNNIMKANTYFNTNLQFNPTYKTNFITGTINITENDINKQIRVINSFENFKKNNINGRVDNELRYRNEEEIKNNCEIKINDKKLSKDFFYFVKMPEPGVYSIEYSFKKNLTKTDFMFANCKNLLNLNLLNFHAQNVTNMAYMFYQCSSLNLLKASNLETYKVNDMSNMFNGCESLENLDLSFIKTNNVFNMSRMFYLCKSLKRLDLYSFDTPRVNNMYCMFFGCQSLTELDLSSFNTQNVKNMSRMFAGCSSLTKLNISNFTTMNVEYMYNLFYEDSSLKALNISNFNTDNIANTESMFYGCVSLKPQNIICKRNVLKKVNYYE